ncbi:hypothetical protein [Micromonospora inyonensis]|uniref:Uncharacterized protein n=1 Tax=Micromonospora inyonensis TaxID=47866 RepID=A0A1C6RDE5_9ACTN|nr:hypothetical protein [Micromonospora inyonensis]SCL15062.1 hypothetical protein GA0074694_1036 [Micromonospora inyonensis]
MNPEGLRCKRALFDRLTAQAGPGLPLAGVQVAYAWPGGTAQREMVYGGGVRFTRTSAGHSGTGELWLETATIGLYIRVRTPGATVEETDARVQEIAGAVEDLLAADPELADGFTYSQMSGGTADYATDDEASVSVLAYQVACQYYLD